MRDVTSAHIFLVKANHLAFYNFKGARKYNFAQFENWSICSTKEHYQNFARFFTCNFKHPFGKSELEAAESFESSNSFKSPLNLSWQRMVFLCSLYEKLFPSTLVDACIPSPERVHVEKEVSSVPLTPHLFMHRPNIRIIPWNDLGPRVQHQSRKVHNRRMAGRNMTWEMCAGTDFVDAGLRRMNAAWFKFYWTCERGSCIRDSVWNRLAGLIQTVPVFLFLLMHEHRHT